MFICPMKVNETVQQRRERAKFNCKNNHLIFSRTEPNRAQQNDTHSSTIIIHNTSNCEFGVFVFVSILMLSFLLRICQTLLLLLPFFHWCVCYCRCYCIQYICDMYGCACVCMYTLWERGFSSLTSGVATSQLIILCASLCMCIYLCSLEVSTMITFQKIQKHKTLWTER